ncbi:laccase domain-containing protein, partial [Aquabacterium sp.]|uniref:polyphenol oxidase family protein n=1 Tax=Aquabacterium sp. TaxID=1872578 RepID=UPI0025B7B519
MSASSLLPSTSPCSADAEAMAWPEGWLCPDLGDGVGALMTARQGGVSQGAYQGCNLGLHVGDDPHAVSANRERVARFIGARPVWLDQVHGPDVLRVRAVAAAPSGDMAPGCAPQADGALSTEPGVVCAVMVADCLPLLLAAPDGRGVAALHAGWRGA